MELKDSLRFLQISAGNFHQKTVRQAEYFDGIAFPRLSELLEKLGSVNVARKPFCPEEYIQRWTDFKNNKVAEISPRVRRFLCWEPSVGGEYLFLIFLAGLNEPLGANALQGLVYSCHERWSFSNSRAEEMNLVRNSVLGYRGRNRLLKKWQGNIDLILGRQSTELAAITLFLEFRSISKFCDEWGINELTQFTREVMMNAAQLCFEQFADVNVNDDAEEFFLSEVLQWKNFQLNEYKSLVSQTILTGKFLNDQRFQESVVDQIINDNRLGDPRLPHNAQRWIGVDEAAKTKLLQILSRADIIFFFDHVMTNDVDRHGRRDFWLQFVPSLKQSRPLLNANDRARLNSILWKQGKKTLHFGETSGQQSAFFLDFGSVLMIEFNGVGACYIYEENEKIELFPNIYISRVFSDAELKRRYDAIDRINHRGNWQWRMKYLLSQYGIRPS